MASLLLVACVMSLILKKKGAAHGLCHEECNILFRFCLLCMPRCCTCLIPAQTMQCCHVAGFVRYIHRFTLNSISFPDGMYVFVFLPFLKVFMPETSVADKYNNCMPVLSMRKDHGSVFAHPCMNTQ